MARAECGGWACARWVGKGTIWLAATMLVVFATVHGLTFQADAATFGKTKFFRRGTNTNRGNRAQTNLGARHDAVSAIPLEKFRPDIRGAISAVVTKPSIFRRLPIHVTECNPSMYLFLVRNPEVVVNIWELMGITQIKLQRTGDYSFQGTDGHGTSTHFDLVFADRDRHIVFGEGIYHGPLLPKPVRGRCVLLLRSDYGTRATGSSSVQSQLDVFVKFDHVGIDFVAKTIHPILGRAVDTNFEQTMSFLGRISRSAERNEAGMHRLANRLPAIRPETRQQFMNLVTELHEQAIVRTAAQAIARTNRPK